MVEELAGSDVAVAPWYLSLTFWASALTLNAVLGLAIFEMTWAKLNRYKVPHEELNERFPMYRRNDAVNWDKSFLRIGAATLLIPRLLVCIWVFVTLLICLNVLMFGHKEGTPLTGARKTILKYVY